MHVETLSIRISKAERAALRARARQEKVSQGQLVRQALRLRGRPHGKARAHRLRSGEAFDRQIQGWAG